MVVVGYTYLDEGEYIGETDPSLGALFPAADEPDVVERFEAWTASTSRRPRSRRASSERPGGFAIGGDRTSLRLLPADVELIRAVAAANPRTVVVIQAGSAVVATEWIDAVPAVVQAWYGGCQAGPGLADVLLGAVNPSARLPFSVPVDEADLPPFDRDATTVPLRPLARLVAPRPHRHRARLPLRVRALLHHLRPRATSTSRSPTATSASSGTVRNTGDRDGADVVQVYAELPEPDAPPRLVGFARVEVPAGGTATVEIAVPVARLATRDPDAHAWQPAAGSHRFVIARHATDPDAITVEADL